MSIGVAVVLDHDLIAKEAAGVLIWFSSNQLSARLALSPAVSPLMCMRVWFACVLILESVNSGHIVVHGIVSGDEGEITGARDWWGALGACWLHGEVNVQMFCATITCRVISAMRCVDAVDLLVSFNTVEVHIHTNLITFFIHLLAELIDASLAARFATLLQFLIGGTPHEDIDVALDFLCG